MTIKPMYVVDYICRYWIGKPDPTGIGKCNFAFYTRQEAERKVDLLKSKGHGSVKLRIVGN